MTERAYWIDHVRPGLEPFGKLQRIENAVDKGTPDVAYCLKRAANDARACAGWIELKYLPQLPANRHTPVILDKLTIDQVLFLEGWTKAGGLAFLLLRADDHHILMNAELARAVFRRGVTAPDLVDRAMVCQTGRFPVGRILSCLCG